MIREHGLLLFMSSDLNMAFIKFQAQKELGRSYAGLYLLNDALYRHGCISQEVYERLEKKYGTKLVESRPKEAPVLTQEQQKEQQLLAQKDRQFKGMLDQWQTHPDPEWRRRAAEHAGKYLDKLESARTLKTQYETETKKTKNRPFERSRP